jgi:membrane protease YdiL (CAAX protease family)
MSNITPAKSSHPFLPHAGVSSREARWAVITGMAIALPTAYLALLMPLPLPNADALAKSTHPITSMPPGLWFLNAVIISPLLEELIFRGILLQLFRRYLPLGVSVVTVTTIFALGHVGISLQNVFAAFFIGLYLTWLFIRSGSLYPGILAHAAANFFWNFVLKFVPGVAEGTSREILVQPAILLILVASLVALIAGTKALRTEFGQATQQRLQLNSSQTCS